ncbi:MAG: PHB depolymerase family esterase [Myxococcales bacterium]|nr:PHB depolymerase family esterase [Myxococcales bacterium]
MRWSLVATITLGLACGKRVEPLDAGVVMALDASVVTPDAGGVTRFEGLRLDQTLGGRRFHVFAPSRAPTETRPLVFLLHGNGGSADQLIGRDGKPAPFRRWLDLAARERLFLLVPDGTEPAGGDRGWNDCRGDAMTNPTTDDVGFLVGLLDELTPQGVDRARVFVNGISNGGNMALRLAIERGELFRAVAPVVASMPANSECAAPSRPVSVLFINGTRDPIMPFDGGVVGVGSSRGTVVSTRAAMDLWRQVNGVSEAEVERAVPDTFLQDRCTVTEVSSRASWPTVKLLRVDEGGHTEPSTAERYSNVYLLVVGRQNGDLELAEEVWRFFSAQGP